MKTWRGLTAEEFYSKRDLRTALEVGEDVRLNSRVRISIDLYEAATFAGQLAFLEVVNLTARWCRQISFAVPQTKLHPKLENVFPGSSLLAAALACAEAIDPFGSFSEGSGSSDPGLHIGSVGEGFSILGRGWVACAGEAARTSEPLLDNLNPLGPAMAACLGASHLLRTVLGYEELASTARISLWNLEVNGEAEDGPAIATSRIGTTAIFGVGAIGGAMVHMLPLCGLLFDRLLLVDADRVELSNLNRVPLFFSGDVDLQKVEVAQTYLARNGIHAEVTANWYSADKVNLGDFDLVVPAANEHGFQPLLMNNYPPLMIAASTGDDWTAYMQRHIPLVEDCLECRLPTAGQSNLRFDCSTGELNESAHNESNVAVSQRTGALPFLSLAGAILAVAEIMKLGIADDYPKNANCVSLRFSTEEYVLMPSQRVPKTSCDYCWNEKVFRSQRSSGRYAGLSGL